MAVSLAEELSLLMRDLEDRKGHSAWLIEHWPTVMAALRKLETVLPEAAPRKVFVVIGGWDYEGNSEPTGVYSTREKAEAAHQHARESHSYDNLEIIEYDLDIGEREADSSPPMNRGEP